MKTEKLWTLMVFAPAAAPGGRERTGARPPHLGAWYPCTGRARLPLESGQKRSVPAANLTFCDGDGAGQPDTRSGHAMRVSVSSVHRGCGSRAR